MCGKSTAGADRNLECLWCVCAWWRQWSTTFFCAAAHLSSYLTYFFFLLVWSKPESDASEDWSVLLICKLCQNYLTVVFIDQRENLSFICHSAAPSQSMCAFLFPISHVFFFGESYQQSKRFLASCGAVCTLHARALLNGAEQRKTTVYWWESSESVLYLHSMSLCAGMAHTRSAHLTWKAARVSLCWSTQLWKARSFWVRWLNYGYPTNLASGSEGISVLHTLTKAVSSLLCLDRTHLPSSASGDDPSITKEMLHCRIWKLTFTVMIHRSGPLIH